MTVAIGVAGDAVGHAGVVVHDEVPGCPDRGPGVDVAVAAHLRAEGTEQERAPGVAGAGRWAEQQGMDEAPGGAAQSVAEGETGLRVRVDVFFRMADMVHSRVVAGGRGAGCARLG